jgi:fido (protein-threonine AMPylation protein)
VASGDAPDGQTPIDEDEAAGLRLQIRTREALNRAEEANIVKALLWAGRSRIVRQKLLTDAALMRIHREMFGGVWTWAGKY